MGAQPVVADSLLALLPHRVKPSGGAAQDVTAAAMNPGFLTATGATRNAGLQAIVQRRVLEDGVASPKHPELRALRFGLVDLTGAARLSSPQFAGKDETVQGGLGSLAKLACMFTAYQLKFDLEELARQKGLSTEKDIFDAARNVWTDAQKRDAANAKTLFAAKPKIEQLGRLIEVDGKTVKVPRPFSAPDLEQLFTFSGGVFKFKGSNLILIERPGPSSPPHTTQRVEKYVQAGGAALNQVRKFTFAERLFLMVDESDNSATHTCLENVSFLYLASSLWQNDIYRPERGGGLWEASTHDGAFRWVLPPVPKGAPGTDFTSATAASVAALLTLIEQDRLVNPEACAAMKHLTSKQKTGLTLIDDATGTPFHPGSYTKSFFEDGLSGAGITFDRIHSKLGIGTHENDGAIIVRTVRPDPADRSKDKQIRYVAAGFDGTEATLHTLIVELDKCIQENNGLITAATP
jgi:hypothetical protein